MKKKLLIVITDVLSVCIAYGLALLLRFDMRYSAVPSEYIRGYLFYIILASVILVSSYTIAKLYRSVWTYAGIPEYCVPLSLPGSQLRLRELPIRFQ